MTEPSELDLMQKQYQYATLETHMLVDGVLHLRCRQCNMRPVPLSWSHVCWCDNCLTDPATLKRVFGPPKG